ncbi:F0F1 ATP synthase subunit epsilon [Clostridium luticellarii]|jgi:F-type H+-transporting ATPase subunit epsilon|uniref:ATP synthase epsilon chain n=1 Tax=Clostridium luticellarii TaxID=1691940 RepID=A0A2T0BQP8_9CLOT|nr:F0F1 ATP synthase subunit epsilon [Clostridium luticellarii]MCI1945314.1 F0F1 ATP synthase subunit epsilon [Clostridium luticellarii]MCI1968625.1 F0F1 ATP synthase subunit epsilon [Clostridium luticellarii]MCI1995805.1 F0F1 ATP synthase subunit epsilon [Clostridium luticellarii]MCI2040099.1 F0F1 ATP synthase subunit epsilon [Clostridium luticellarii]PRR86197.1 ATP synthase epsilon chain [Clostridium luticellarii]
MSKVLKLTVLTPDREFYQGEVIKVITESTLGGITILPDHMPLITTLKPADTVIVQKDNKELKAFTSVGVLEVKENELRILCDVCEWPEEIDIRRAEEARDRAEKRLTSNKDGIDVQRAELALARALARINLKQQG